MKISRSALSLIVLGLLVIAALASVYGYLIHRETQAANKLSAYLNKNISPIRFQYHRVSYNPFQLFIGNDALYGLKFQFPQNDQSITIKAFKLTHFDLTGSTVSHLTFQLNGLEVKTPLIKHPILKTLLQSTQADITVNLQNKSLSVVSNFKQATGSIAKLNSTYGNIPNLSISNPAGFINSLGQLQVHHMNFNVNMPLNIKLTELVLPPAVLGALKEMHYNTLPLFIAGFSTYDGNTLTGKTELNIQLKNAFDVLMHANTSFKHPVYLGQDLLLLSNLNVKAIYEHEDNKHINSATATLIDQGFTNRLLSAIAKTQKTSASALKTRIRGSLGNIIGASSTPAVKDTFIALQKFITHPQSITLSMQPESPMPATFPLKYFIVRKSNQIQFEKELHSVKSITEREKLIEEFEAHQEASTKQFLKVVGYSVS